MRNPPSKPTLLRLKGIGITLPKPTLIIDSMEQRPYSRRFHKWFATIERRKLASGGGMLLCGRVGVISQGVGKKEVNEYLFNYAMHMHLRHCTIAPVYLSQICDTAVASHWAMAALTSTGFSWAIQCPDGMMTSDRLGQSCRIGSARRDAIVSQV